MSKLKKEIWGKLENGDDVIKYTVKGNRICVSFINFGASVQRLTFDGTDIIFSLPDAATYAKFSQGCIGATVGRYAGRIAKGHLEIDGVTYQLPINQSNCHMHGGVNGFNTKIWESEAFECDDCAGVEFTLLSPDGDEGYPGNLDVKVRFTVTDNDELCIKYTAHTDKPTVLNLTNHCYFNLNGFKISDNSPLLALGKNSDIEMTINADYVTELSEYIPTGKFIDVSGTPFDFRKGKIISEGADKITDVDGYDHNFVLNSPTLDTPSITARSLKTGIQMECFTDRPGVQLFSMGADGSSFALETQSFPDSPNHPNFPSTVLRPNKTFSSTTVYKFSMQK